MSIMTSMAKALAGTGKWLRNKAKDLLDDSTPTAVADAPISDRYLHISKPITEDVRLATQLGLHRTAAQLLRNQRGSTLYTPEGRVKKQADKLAGELGMSNKDRRRLRSMMRRRLRDMQAGAA